MLRADAPTFVPATTAAVGDKAIKESLNCVPDTSVDHTQQKDADGPSPSQKRRVRRRRAEKYKVQQQNGATDKQRNNDMEALEGSNNVHSNGAIRTRDRHKGRDVKTDNPLSKQTRNRHTSNVENSLPRRESVDKQAGYITCEGITNTDDYHLNHVADTRPRNTTNNDNKYSSRHGGKRDTQHDYRHGNDKFHRGRHKTIRQHFDRDVDNSQSSTNTEYHNRMESASQQYSLSAYEAGTFHVNKVTYNQSVDYSSTSNTWSYRSSVVGNKMKPPTSPLFPAKDNVKLWSQVISASDKHEKEDLSPNKEGSLSSTDNTPRPMSLTHLTSNSLVRLTSKRSSKTAAKIPGSLEISALADKGKTGDGRGTIDQENGSATSQSESKVFAFDNKNSAGSSPKSLSTTAPPPPTIRSVVNRSATVNMDRLRDRLWDLLRDRTWSNPEPNSAMLPTICDDQQEVHALKSSHLSLMPKSPAYFADPIQAAPAPATKRGDAYENAMNADMLRYRECVDPLHEAIRQNDVAALCALCKNWQSHKDSPNDSPAGERYNNSKVALSTNAVQGKQTDPSAYTPLEWAVYLDRPECVRVILHAIQAGTYCEPESISRKSSTGCLDTVSQAAKSQFTDAILMTVKYRHEACLQVFLSEGATSMWWRIRDEDDNNLLHCLCQSRVSVENWRMAIGISASSSGSVRIPSVIESKLLSSANCHGQLPLHLACASKRMDIVEDILSTASLSFLAKWLRTLDERLHTPFLTAVWSGSTDVVMSFLMWRGNNMFHSHHHQQPSQAPCPLLVAVHSGRVSMVSLLLEFYDPSSSIGVGYNLTQALYAALEVQSEASLEMIGILIDAGANPCKMEDNSSRLLPRRNTLSWAVLKRNMKGLSLAIDRYTRYLTRTRISRRGDPVLQKQPESFFAGIESKEDAEMTSALRDALVTSLFLGWMTLASDRSEVGEVSTDTYTDVDGDEADTKDGSGATDESTDTDGGRQKIPRQYYDCSFLLWSDRMVQLGASGLERLKLSLVSGSLIPASDVLLPAMNEYVYKGAFYPSSDMILSESQRQHGYWTVLMCNLDWMDLSDTDALMCRWMRNHGRSYLTEYVDLVPDVSLVVSDGTIFAVHSAVVSAKSAKLAAAIRFEKMQRGCNDSDGSLMCVNVDITGQLCQLLLEHIYHRSVVSLHSMLSGGTKARSGATTTTSTTTATTIVGDKGPTAKREYCNVLLQLLLVAQEFLCPSLILECEMRLLTGNVVCCKCPLCSYSLLSDHSLKIVRGDKENNVVVYEGSIYKSNIHKSSNSSIAGNRDDEALIGPQSALDVLSVSQHIDESSLIPDDSYQICVAKSNNHCLGSEYGLSAQDGNIKSGPMELMRQVALDEIFLDYIGVIKRSGACLSPHVCDESDSSVVGEDNADGGNVDLFGETFRTDDAYGEEKYDFLSMCLCELARIQSNRSSKTRHEACCVPNYSK
jgi:hypothetical protein